jgi:hypothetical protein
VDTVLVVRSHPIRVAGNSGPMPHEITWPILARRINKKLDARSLRALVPEHAIQDFEQALKEAIIENFPLATEELGDLFVDQFHLWSEEQRVRFRVCLSEANALALRRLPEHTLNQLAFFEKTTVTRKLRRIADLDCESVRYAIQMNGPTRIAYTFLNYDLPQLNNDTDRTAVMFESRDRVDFLTEEFGVPIQYVTTGPLAEHVINLND